MSSILSNGTITLRPFAAGDVEQFYLAMRASITHLSRWMPWCHDNYSIEESKAWLQTCQDEWSKRSSYPYLIFGNDNREVLGGVDINQVNRGHNFGNVGYWIAAPHVRKGIAVAATKLIAQFGFAEVGLSRLEIVTLVDNTASRRVAEKVGATFECIARNRLSGWGKAFDAALYSLIQSDLNV